MSDFYKPRRTRNLYDPKDIKPFKVSRSRIEQFLNCGRCFYLDRKLGVSAPPGFPFNLNSAVDSLLKREFDQYREMQKPHPFMKNAGIKAIPFRHRDLDRWRDALRGGVTHLHEETNLLVSGGVDDIWTDSDGWLNVVDYKATSKAGEVNLDADWQAGYKRQIEIYQWLLRQNGFKVSDTSYFVYCNGNAQAKRFDKCLEFEVKVIPYSGNDSWVEETICRIKVVLDGEVIPEPGRDCDHCAYLEAVEEVKSQLKRA